MPLFSFCAFYPLKSLDFTNEKPFFVQQNNRETLMSILVVVNFHRKDIAFVSRYLHVNNAPPSIFQANTSKKVSILVVHVQC